MMNEMDKLHVALTERGIEHQYNKTSPEIAEKMANIFGMRSVDMELTDTKRGFLKSQVLSQKMT